MKNVGRSLLFALPLAAMFASLPAVAASGNISLTTPTGVLHGTLLLPDRIQGPLPVALIVAGSGPTDRDGNNPLGVTASSYRLLAEALAARGIASVRYDKRGIAASAPAARPGAAVTFDGFVDDAASWLHLLHADRRFSRVAIVGHSEGALIALLAPAQAPVDAVISVSGSGRPIGEVILAQVAAQGPQAAPFLSPLRAAIDAVKAGRVPENVPPELAPLFPAYLATFSQQLFRVDPAIAARSVHVPFAIVQGLADVQITEDDARLLAAANSHATLTLVPHMTHVLKDAQDDTRAASLATYADASLPIDLLAVDAIAKGILAP